MDAASYDEAGEPNADDWRWPLAGVTTTTVDAYDFRWGRPFFHSRDRRVG